MDELCVPTLARLTARFIKRLHALLGLEVKQPTRCLNWTSNRPTAIRVRIRLDEELSMPSQNSCLAQKGEPVLAPLHLKRALIWTKEEPLVDEGARPKLQLQEVADQAI